VKAVQLSTGRSVALKVLDVDASDPGARRRFDRERGVMAALATHPHIVTIHDAGIQDGMPWLAMELCTRGSLGAYVANHGPLDARTGLAVLISVATALSAVHERGILRSDIKPANILLTDRGEIAVGDFGIARISLGRATTTTAGRFTLDHVAPELLEKGRSSTATDVYSLGTTL